MKMITQTALAMTAAAALAVPAAAAGIASSEEQVWTRYTNDRFGASAEVPGLGFAPEPAPANGDGQGWTAGPGVQIAVYGNYWTAMTESFSEYRDLSRSFVTDDGASVTYEPTGEDWFVLSGYLPDGRIYYTKTVTAPGCAISANIHLEYPQDLREPMDAITTRMANSLMLDTAYCGD